MPPESEATSGPSGGADMDGWRVLGSLPILLAAAGLGCTALRQPAARHASPEQTTRQNMVDTLLRIREYMIQHRKYPLDLTGLPTLDDHGSDTNDGWGRPLHYAVSADGVISLTSLGRDGLPGGTKADADIRRRYRTLNRDGTSNIDDEYRIVTQSLDPVQDDSKHVDDNTPAVDTRATDRTRTP
jgi:hypothetical protein